MADNEEVDTNIPGGVNGYLSELGNRTAKKAEADAADDHLKQRIEEMEHQQRDLVQENREMKAAELERSEMERKEIASIRKRAFELEGEVVSLRHDLATSMNSGDEANREIKAPRAEIEELKWEKGELFEKLSEEADELKRLKSDSDCRIGELEKEIDQSKAAAEQQAKPRLDEMEREIIQLKKEKEEVEDTMGALRVALKKSEDKVMEMEGRVSELLKKSEEPGKQEKAALGEINGIVEAAEGDGGLRGLKGKKKRFPVVGAVTAGVVVVALAVWYLRFRRRR